MSDGDIDLIASQLANTQVEECGVTFAGKGLHIMLKSDAAVVVEAIANCPRLDYLCLEGNTLGVEAAEAIGEELKKHPELQRALWKDLFTGRLKTEIPPALKHLGNGLIAATASLTELDLSDNAFGPVGVEGLKSLLSSPVCYGLKILRLNNNGLGIGGGKMLSQALIACQKLSSENGRPLSLRTFVCGRNRLENDGAKAMAKFFKAVGSLEEVAMPQNGIFHVGIAALADSFTYNCNLHTINLNDNIFSKKGAQAIANALPFLKKLKSVNFGDCLLKSKGGFLLAEALKGKKGLEDVQFGFNELNAQSGLALTKAVVDLGELKKIVLSGNCFAESGIKLISDCLKEAGRTDIELHVSDDEGTSDMESEVEEEEEEEQEEEEGEENGSNGDGEKYFNDDSIFLASPTKPKALKEVAATAKEFIETPTGERLLGLGENRASVLLEEVQKITPKENRESYLKSLIVTFVKVASFAKSEHKEVENASMNCSLDLLKEAFLSCGSKIEEVSVGDILFEYLGLVKSEDKQFMITWNLEGCFTVLDSAVQQEYFPSVLKVMLRILLIRPTLDLNCEASQKVYCTLTKS